MYYTLVRNGEEANITVFLPGHTEPLLAHSSNVNFAAIREIVESGDEAQFALLPDLFSPEKAVATKFEQCSERVSVRNGQVYLDGDVVDNSLTKQIVRFLSEGVDDWQPLVAFMENVQANPQEHSREQLYRWLERHDFTITPEGNFVGYKGVRVDSNGEYTSISRGPAIVDGEEVNGYVPNPLGATVEIARSYVTHDPGVGCAKGLHVGTHSYAKSWSGSVGAVLEVHVNPRDVVSVPTDCNDQKVRTCRYVVVDVIDEPYSTAVTEEYVDDDGDFDWIDDLDEDFDLDDPVEESVEDWEVEEEPQKDSNGFVIGSRVRITDEEFEDGLYDCQVGVVEANDNGLSSLTKVRYPDGDYDYFYASEIEPVDEEQEDASVTFVGGFKAGDHIEVVDEESSTLGKQGVVTDDEGAKPSWVPAILDGDQWTGYYAEDEIKLVEEQVSYHGHQIGERWQQEHTGVVFRVCLRPTNPEEYGYPENSIPMIREDSGTHDAVSPGSLQPQWGWKRL